MVGDAGPACGVMDARHESRRPARGCHPVAVWLTGLALAGPVTAQVPASPESSAAVAPVDSSWTAEVPAFATSSDVGYGALSLWLGLGAAAGGALLADEAARDVTSRWDSETVEEVAEAGRWVGTWEKTAPIALAATFAVGAATEGTTGLRKGVAIVTGTLTGSLANEVLNQVVGRRRPPEERGSMSFAPFTGHSSFPSGHTSFAFSLAGSIDAVTEGWAPAAFAYTAATVAGLSRVYHDRHWLSDVLVGAAIGVGVSRNVTKLVFGLIEPDPEPGYHPSRDGLPERNDGLAERLELQLGPGLAALRLRF